MADAPKTEQVPTTEEKKVEEVKKVEEPAKEAPKDEKKEEEKKVEAKPASSASAADETPDVNVSDEYKTLEEGEDVLFNTYVPRIGAGDALFSQTIALLILAFHFASLALQTRDPPLYVTNSSQTHCLAL